MRSVEFRNVTKLYHGETVVENLDLTIPSGKFFALLGPSGCGKTTLLRLIGGFEEVDSGDVFLGETSITRLPSNERRINTVFQSYALFPHLNVFDNIAYSLRVRGVDTVTIRKRVGRIAETFGIERHLARSVTQLSGGQQQRVAIARAVINEPDVLLLDEPLAALDSKLRERLLMELVDLQDMLQTTFVYVTHDPLEALAVADQMAIMGPHGTIEQLGTPREIYEYPVSSFVARFLGTTNVLEGVVKKNTADEWQLEVADLGDLILDQSAQTAAASGALVAENVARISIRPEKIMITKVPQLGQEPGIFGRVDKMFYNGHSTMYHVRVNDSTILRVFEQNEEHTKQEVINYDDMVYLYWLPKNVVVLER